MITDGELRHRLDSMGQLIESMRRQLEAGHDISTDLNALLDEAAQTYAKMREEPAEPESMSDRPNLIIIRGNKS